MRLEYNVLWFENDNRWLKPIKKQIAKYLDEFGFILNPIVYKNGDHLEDILKKISLGHLEIDLILMDYKLATGRQGDELIRRIRRNELYTEIIFYSEKEDVRRIIERSDGPVEGIYFAGRDIFVQKVKAVAKNVIRKVEEVNTVRGLIISHTSLLDHKMLELVRNFIENEDSLSKELEDYIFKKAKTHFDKKEKKVRKIIAERNINGFLNTSFFSAFMRSLSIQKILKLKKVSLDIGGDLDFHNSYHNNVIRVRNNFAHTKVETDENGVKVLAGLVNGQKEVFTRERCIEIRKKLIEHTGFLEEIEEQV